MGKYIYDFDNIYLIYTQEYYLWLYRFKNCSGQKLEEKYIPEDFET